MKTYSFLHFAKTMNSQRATRLGDLPSGPNAFRLQVLDWWSDSVVYTITEIRGSISRNSG